MEIIINALKSTHKLVFFLLPAAIVLLFVQASTLRQNQSPQYVYQNNDSLLAYINRLFDKTDETPTLVNKADSLFSTIWRQPVTVDEKLAWYQLTINIAYHLLQSGQVQQSTRWYEQAFRFWQQNRANTILVKEMEVEEYVCKPLGNNYTRLGDFSKAVFIQQTAIESAINNHKQQMLPALYANLATTFFYMQEYPSVQSIAHKGLSAIDSDNIQDAVLLYNLKAEAYLETHQTDSARYWNEKALRQNNAADKNRLLTSVVDEARILSTEEKYKEALIQLRKAWLLATNTSPREKAKIANETGIGFLKTGNARQGKAWLFKALNFFHRDSLGLYPDFTVTTTMFGIAQCYEKELNADSTSYWYTQAVLNDYYTQQLIDPWMYSKSSIYSNEALTEQAIAWHHTMYDRFKTDRYLLRALWIAELSKGRKLMYEQQRSQRWQSGSTFSKNTFEDIRNDYLLLAQAGTEQEKQAIKERLGAREYHLSLEENNFAQTLQAPSFQSFTAWLNKEKKNSTIVSYFCGDSSFYMIQINASGLSHHIETATSFKDIYAFIKAYFYNNPLAFDNNPAAYYAASYHLLQKYLPQTNSGKGHYIICPSGALHQLPFEALCTVNNQPLFWGEQHSVSYQFSLLQLLNAVPNPVSGISAFSFGKAHQGFEALPQVAEEVSFLKKIFKTTQYPAEQTTDSLFYAALNSGNVIHLASHAVSGDSTEQPFIVLKQKLYLGQIQYNTARCPLIVLAACETGKGTNQQNEGMLSLGRAFISKGVKGVLSARWQVDNIATTGLMKGFYKELKNGCPPAVALQNARAAYLGDKKSMEKLNPWLWAGFYYQGDNQAISIRPAFNYWPVLIAVVAAVLLAFLLFKQVRTCR